MMQLSTAALTVGQSVFENKRHEAQLAELVAVIQLPFSWVLVGG